MNQQPRPFILAETNWKEIQQHQFDIAVLPWGATEAHNYHMPYGTDNYQVDYLALASAEIAWNKGNKVIVLPNIPFGVNTGQLDVPFCINMNPSTQLAILNDVCDVLLRHGITKLVVLNGHGANNFVSMIRELAGKFPSLFVCVINWFNAAPKHDIFQNKGDHADEMETSVMMHLYPHLLLLHQYPGLERHPLPHSAAPILWQCRLHISPAPKFQRRASRTRRSRHARWRWPPAPSLLRYPPPIMACGDNRFPATLFLHLE